MIWFDAAIAFIKNNTKLVVVGVLSLALVFGALYTKSWYKDQITASYNLGVTDTDTKWNTKQLQNKADNAEFKNDQQAKVDDLAQQLADEKEKSAKLQSDLDKKQADYGKSDAGKRQGLDNAFVDIYNQSLGLK